jgi:hypothetical protein
VTDTVHDNVLRRVIATTAEDSQAVLASLPHGVRFGVARQLDETGEAYRYESARHCFYFLRRWFEDSGIEVWRWSYIDTEQEAARLRALISVVSQPLDAALASWLFEQATFRTVNDPRPAGMEYFALDFGGYPAMYVAGQRAAAGAKPAA